MRRLHWVIFGVALALFMGPLLSSGADDEKKSGRGDKDGRFGRPTETRPLIPSALLDKLKLTDEQKEKISKLDKEYQGKEKDALDKDRDAVRKAFEDGDRDAGRKALEKMREDREKIAKVREEYLGKATAVLTDEQKKTLNASADRPRGDRFGPGERRTETAPSLLSPRILEKLSLSDEQKDKIAKLEKDIQAKEWEAYDKDRDAIRKAREDGDRDASRKALEKFREDGEKFAKLREEYVAKATAVLTDEQKKKYDETKNDRSRVGPGERPAPTERRPEPSADLSPRALERLGLTAEQKEKIAKLQKELDGKIKDLLTDEQKKKLDDLKRDGSDRPRDRSR